MSHTVRRHIMSVSALLNEEGREPISRAPRHPSLIQPTESIRDVYGPRMDPGTPAPRMSTRMFGDNNMISGGQFHQAQNIIHNHNSGTQGIDLLQRLLEHVSCSAFHNSAERYDPPRCHPNTRVEVLETIRYWAIQYAHNRKAWILWLNGAAGAGKSAIMQSIAELLLRYSSIAIASFFFSRGDSTRNTVAPLVSTLAYQLIQEIPETSEFILSTIAHNPLIFKQSLEFQLQQLIIQPLMSLPPSSERQFVVIIDGLDECLNRDHQANLIKVVGNICIGKDIPIIFAIASRREPQIQFEFNQETVSHMLETIPLDDSEASDDIRRYLNAKFMDIKKTHPVQDLLPPDWPSISAVTEIVEKSSNQFIYASTVIKYISSPHAHPAQQLKVILDLQLLDPLSEHPFAYLDSLYRHIFSQVKNLDQVLDILAFYLLSSYGTNTKILEEIFMMESGTLQILFLDLTAVIQFKLHDNCSSMVSFLHASLPDFLLDPIRSQKYFLDLAKYCNKLLCKFLGYSFLETLSSNNMDEIEHWVWTWLSSIRALLNASLIPSNQLQQAFINFDPISLRCGMDENIALQSVQLVESLKELDFGDNGQAYQHVLNLFAEGLANSWTSYDDEIKNYVRDYPDVCARICQLQPRLARRPSLNSLDSDEENPSDDDDIDDSISDE